ncbi:hypothetical protein [Actinomadura rudentiformis]|uniref:Uncharacterized protein n=1 Tax=Actinomadura rudentiformis TaxID=359158 RepID=A0A6H9YM67_9ACTN|nr:hypothetical protein [Actinomadura rudentiformis]KAB2341522.1 hypothetical protein F8566_40985 [Actinomadura rudentiformis]
MNADQARQIGRHVKAALLHQVTADRATETAGVDMLGNDGDWRGYVTETGVGPARAFRAALDAVEELDEWAIGNAGACGAGSETYAGTERWCHTEFGVLPLGDGPGTRVSPERMRSIASVADGLAHLIEFARADSRSVAAPDGAPAARPVDTFTEGDLARRAGFRLPDAAGQARQIAREMRQTATSSERIAAVPTDACRIPWPVCPEHGNTISSTGGRSWCRRPGCGRRWDYDRGDIPCPEPVRWRVTDQHGDGGPMCDGHALDARTALIGGTVVPLDEDEGRQP